MWVISDLISMLISLPWPVFIFWSEVSSCSKSLFLFFFRSILHTVLLLYLQISFFQLIYTVLYIFLFLSKPSTSSGNLEFTKTSGSQIVISISDTQLDIKLCASHDLGWGSDSRFCLPPDRSLWSLKTCLPFWFRIGNKTLENTEHTGCEFHVDGEISLCAGL